MNATHTGAAVVQICDLRRENRSLAANLSKSHTARAQSPHEITRAASTQQHKTKPREHLFKYIQQTRESSEGMGKGSAREKHRRGVQQSTAAASECGNN